MTTITERMRAAAAHMARFEYDHEHTLLSQQLRADADKIEAVIAMLLRKANGEGCDLTPAEIADRLRGEKL